MNPSPRPHRAHPLIVWPSLRWTTRFGLLGCFIAVALMGILHFGSGVWTMRTHFFVLKVAETIWPSSILLLATAGQEDSLAGWTIVGMSIAANAALYALLGAVASVFRRSQQKRRADSSARTL